MLWKIGRTIWFAALTIVLFRLARQDLREKRIPDRYPVEMVILSCVRWLLCPAGLPGELAAGTAVYLCGFLLWAVSDGRSFGGGDIRTAAAAALFLGEDILYALLLAGLLTLAVYALRRAAGRTERELAFGPGLAAGIWLLAGKQLLLR